MGVLTGRACMAVFILNMFCFLDSVIAQSQFGVKTSYKSEIALPKAIALDVAIQNRYIVSEVDTNFWSIDDYAIQILASSGEGFAAGFLGRVDNHFTGFKGRLIEEFTFNSDVAGLPLEQRLRADQTFQSGEDARYRLRYRVSYEHALQGVDVDPNE